MAGLEKYFLDTPYQVVDGNIVYASSLNSPFSAIASGMETLSIDIQTSGSKYAVDTGATANTYVVSIDPAPTEYIEGLEIWLKTSSTNTGAATINVNSLGAIDIRRYGLDPLLEGDIPANYFTLLKYSNGFFQIVSASGRSEAEYSAEIATEQAEIATEQAEIVTTAMNKFPDFGPADVGDLLQVDSSGNLELLSKSDLVGVPIGGSIMWDSDIMPTVGVWKKRNGVAISRTSYAKAFSILGVSFGSGDGSTTFNLPDNRGEFPRMVDDGAGVDLDASTRTDRGDNTTGDNVGTKQGDSNKSHDHIVDPPSTQTTSDTHRHENGLKNGTNSTPGFQPVYATGQENTLYTGYDTHGHYVNIAAFNSESTGGNQSCPINFNTYYIMRVL